PVGHCQQQHEGDFEDHGSGPVEVDEGAPTITDPPGDINGREVAQFRLRQPQPGLSLSRQGVSFRGCDPHRPRPPA
ncbi:MAG: hypothetical protein V7668_20990, partial [Cereibacter changlensis]